MKRPLVYYGNPLLRARSQPVETIDDELRALVADMIETLDGLRGAGLAAVQIGVLRRIFIIRPYVQQPSGRYVPGPVEVYINPVLSDPSSEEETAEEGCLSIPGLHAEVTRPLGITIEALDLDGKKIHKKIWGYTTRMLMHENDHLNGVLYIDRLTPPQRQWIKPQLKKIEKRFS